MLESLPAGVIIYDRDNCFVAGPTTRPTRPCRQWCLAMKPGKAVARGGGDRPRRGLFPPERRPRAGRDFTTPDREAWVDGYIARYDEKMRVFERSNPDGRWFKAFDMRLEDGTYVGVRVDISELKQREKALRESMDKIELFNRVLDELPVSTYVQGR